MDFLIIFAINIVDFFILYAQLKDDYCHELDERNKQILRIRHDLKNSLYGLCCSMEVKDHCIQEKTMEILELLNQSDQHIYTANNVFNGILNIKFYEAKQLKIHIECSVLIPQYTNLDCEDMGILLGNLLDNAIEACMVLEEDKRWLNLSVKYMDSCLVLLITNSKNSAEITDLKTRKKDAANHGIGLKSICKIAEKYNGSVQFIDKGAYFEASVILYRILNLKR